MVQEKPFGEFHPYYARRASFLLIMETEEGVKQIKCKSMDQAEWRVAQEQAQGLIGWRVERI